MRAIRAGTLPSAVGGVVVGVKLPAGRPIVPDASYSSNPGRGQVGWISDAPAKIDDWKRLAEAFPETGLWPLVLTTLDDDGQRPWRNGELDLAGSSDPDQHDAGAVLTSFWERNVPVPEEDDAAFEPLAPFRDRFPGLAEPTPGGHNSGALYDVVSEVPGSLGLVAVTRPADAVVALGWSGPINHFDDMGMLAAVLRSWEERFGAYVVGIGFDTLTLAVARPLSTRNQALAVAAEHFAACSDNVYQGAESIEAYAETLIGASVWSFWWD